LRISKQIGVAAMGLMALTLAVLAPAAEQATLTNGFALRCDHHAQVEGRVRLYLNAGENNYIELHPDEIAGFQQLAEPALPPAQSTMGADAQLSQADLEEMLAEAGRRHNLDVDLLASVVKAESNGNARAVSRAGARGLMQLMPSTAAGLGVDDSFKPGENVRGGSTYLDALLTRYHDNLALALAAYNAGPAAVDRYHGIPPYHETRAYVARVIHEFNHRVQARHGAQARRAGLARTGSAGLSQGAIHSPIAQ
jgi:hypothetical protein